MLQGSSSNNGSPTRSSSPTNDARSSTSQNHRALGSTRDAAGPHVDVHRESSRTDDHERQERHEREGNTPIGVDVHQVLVSEGGGFGDADGGSGGSGGSLEPRRNGGDDAMGASRASIAPRSQDEREATDKREGETHPTQATIAQTVKENPRLDHPKDLSDTPPEKDAHGATIGRGGNHGALRNVSITPNKTSQPGKLGGSIEHASFSTRGVEDKEGGDSPRERWRETERDATHDHDHPVSVGAQPDSKKSEAGLKGENDASGNRAPRLVTVSVKPRGIRQQSSPDSAASNSPRVRGEDSYASSPDGSQATQGSAASGAHPSGQGGGSDVGEGNESRLTHGVHSSTRAGVSRYMRPGRAAGENRPSSSAAGSSFSPSRLGIEGEGYPDALEFDLDDISEIDAGGEWAAEGGEGSLSS